MSSRISAASCSAVNRKRGKPRRHPRQRDRGRHRDHPRDDTDRPRPRAPSPATYRASIRPSAPALAACPCQCQCQCQCRRNDVERGGKATTFVQLDVDRVVQACTAIDIIQCIETLVGAKRNDSIDISQLLVQCARHRLFDQGDAKVTHPPHRGRQGCDVPTFVDIGQQRRQASRSAYGRHAIHIEAVLCAWLQGSS